MAPLAPPKLKSVDDVAAWQVDAVAPERSDLKEPTPVSGARPWKLYMQLAAIFAALFVNCLAFTLPFPFLPFMIKDFGYDKEEDVGYYAGFVASAMFFGSAVGSLPLGHLLDRVGRRPILMLSLVSMTITTYAFGFSVNLPMAVCMRFLSGMLNAIAIGCKACISELCEPSLQGTMMASLTVAWGVGLVLGSAAGGILCQPADKFPALDFPLFREFPYLLPCLVVGTASGAATLLNYIFLPETKYMEAGVDMREAAPPAAAHTHRSQEHDTVSSGSLSASESEESETKALLGTSLGSSHAFRPIGTSTETRTADRPAAAADEKDTKPGMLSLLKDRTIARLVLLYGIFSLATTSVDELISVYLATPLYLGGVGWNSSDIGTTLAIVGGMMMCIQYLLFPPLERRFKSLGVFFIACTITSVVNLLHPCLNFVGATEIRSQAATTATITAGDQAVTADGPLTMGAAVITITAFKVMNGCCFTSMSILQNNSVFASQRGLVNGISMAFTALCRAFGPTASGTVFSWSISTSRPFPFNWYFVFILVSVVYWVSLGISSRLPTSLNQPKTLTSARKNGLVKGSSPSAV